MCGSQSAADVGGTFAERVEIRRGCQSRGDQFHGPVTQVDQQFVEYRFDSQAQERIDELARKGNEGGLTAGERREYETYVQTIDFISILQAKARSVLKRAADA